MTARRYRLLVFDWDGTLVDSADAIVEALQDACRDVGQPLPPVERARYVIGLGLAEAIRHVAPALDEASYPRLAERYRDHYLRRDPDIALFDGVAELLAELDRRGFLLAVATGKSRRGLERAFAQVGLGARFAASRCADEGHPKPHPDMLLHLMERLAVPPAEMLMIGDTTHDLELARNAGVDGLAVTYGAHPPQPLQACAPVASAASVGMLGDWLLSLPPPRA